MLLCRDLGTTSFQNTPTHKWTNFVTMGSMKSFALLFGLLGFAASSMASFDMMMIHDSTGNRVHRYDPINGSYFGSVELPLVPNAMVASFAQKRLFVVGGSGVSSIDYSTGEVKNGQSVGGVGIAVVGNELWVATGTNTIRRFRADDSLTTLSSLTLPAGAQITDLAGRAGGFVLVHDEVNNVLYQTNTSGSILSSIAFGAGPATDNLVALEYFTSNEWVFSHDAGTGIVRYNGIAQQPSSAFVSISGGYAPSSMGTTAGIVAGHSGGYFYGTNPGGAKVIQRFSGFGADGGSVLTPHIGTYSGIAAIVLAPEPTTMIALGIGCAVALRRRKA